MDNVSVVTPQPQISLRSTILLWLVWMIWLPLFVPSFVGLMQSSPSFLRASISICGALAFFILYGWISWLAARNLAAHSPRAFPTGWALWWPALALVALAVSLTLYDGYDWGSLFIYTASGVAGWLPTRSAALTIAGMVAFIGLGLGLSGQFALAISPMVFVGIVGTIVIAYRTSFTNSQQLRLAREEMARAAAINEERLRIARDLHDLLGRNLSLIALKSELAQRLMAVAPDRAASEIGDIEQVARTALQEVREAVANYRTPTLVSELHHAQAILDVAGIAYQCETEAQADDARILPQPVEAVLSWAVREGVTNVIRHSRARHCAIQLAYTPETIIVAISDDGIGVPAPSEARGTGNGLRGLAERAAALGGSSESGPRAEGGYRLSVTLPRGMPETTMTMPHSAMSEAMSAKDTIPALQAGAQHEGEMQR